MHWYIQTKDKYEQKQLTYIFLEVLKFEVLTELKKKKLLFENFCRPTILKEL